MDKLLVSYSLFKTIFTDGTKIYWCRVANGYFLTAMQWSGTSYLAVSTYCVNEDVDHFETLKQSANEVFDTGDDGALKAMSATTWGYQTGSSGTVNLAGKRVLSIRFSTGLVSGTLNINGIASISLAASKDYDVPIRALLLSPTLVFTNTSSYFVEYLTI